MAALAYYVIGRQPLLTITCGPLSCLLLYHAFFPPGLINNTLNYHNYSSGPTLISHWALPGGDADGFGEVTAAGRGAARDGYEAVRSKTRRLYRKLPSTRGRY